MKILVAADGSKSSLHAVDYLVEHCAMFHEQPQVELVTVHLPVPKLPRMGMVVGKSQIRRYYDEEGEARLKPARKKLDAAHIPYRAVIRIGEIASELVSHAAASGCELIVIGSRGLSAVGKALLGSTATKVLHISNIPVLLVK